MLTVTQPERWNWNQVLEIPMYLLFLIINCFFIWIQPGLNFLFPFLKMLWAVTMAVPASVFCFNSVWTEGTQGCPSSSLRPLSSLFPVTAFRTTSATLSLRGLPTPCCSLNSLLPNNHELSDSSELFHRGGGPVNHLVTLVTRAPMHTSLWASISAATM